jgi:multidrug efflux system membrane fusion protein
MNLATLFRTTIVFLGLFLVGCSEEAPPAPVKIQPAKVFTVGEQFRQSRDIPGTVRAAQRSDLSFQVPGKIVEFSVKEGQQVIEGDVLGRLDDRDYQSTVDADRAERDRSKANFERAEELIVGNFISQSDYDKIKANFDISTAQLERTEKALADTKIVAPFSGVIARTFVENFEDIQAKQPILSLQDMTDLELVVAVSETLVVRRQKNPNMDLSARFDALPDRVFDLYLKEFASEADPQTQTFEVVVGIADKNVTSILPGMTATVTISQIDKSTGPLVIPLVALVAGEGSASSVWKVESDNKLTRRVVATGSLIGADQIEITSGLMTGDMIVTAGLSSLTEGKEITPVTEVSY